MTQALNFLSASLQSPSSFANGYMSRIPSATNLSAYITPVQFERIAADIRMWRNAIREIELAHYPQRVLVNRMYMDVVENPYIKAVLDRWRELTIQRDYIVYQVKDGKKIKSEVLTQAIEEQSWFGDYLSYVADALLYGYSLIELGEIVDDQFPNLSITRRENIRPDGYGGDGSPILTSLTYAIDGIRIKDNGLIDMCNHWVPTKTDRGVSKCGAGMLYNISLTEIHLRHILEWNMDYVEMHGMPIKKGTTRKTGKDRKNFESFLRNSASNAYVLLDKGTEDNIEYVMAANAGTAFKCYENIEMRLKDIVSQLLLGHTDAMKSTAGKLGGLQNSNKDGNNISLVQQAMNAKQVSVGNFVCNVINNISAPRFRQLGDHVGSKIIENLIPMGYKFGLLNDTEENEIKRRENADRTAISTYVKTLNDAGWDIKDAKVLSDRLGIEVIAKTPEQKMIQERTTTVHSDNATAPKSEG